VNSITAPIDHSFNTLNLDVMKNLPIPYVADKQLEVKVNTANVVVLNILGEKNL
jgi:hypothetical protein